MKALSAFRLLLLASWLGAAVFFIAVAQSAFAVIPSREVAGGLVGRNLAILNYSGIGISIIALLTSLISSASTNRILLWAERLLLIVFGLACAIAQFVITWWMLLLRTQMGKPIDEVAADDPLRIQFNNLHEYSSWLMLTALAATLIAFVIISFRSNAAGKKGVVDDLDFQTQFKI